MSNKTTQGIERSTVNACSECGTTLFDAARCFICGFSKFLEEDMSGYTRINAGAVAFAASEGMNPEFVAATYSDATHPVFKVIIRFAQSQFELRRYGDWAERAIAAHALFEKDEFARDEVLTAEFKWNDATIYGENSKREVE